MLSLRGISGPYNGLGVKIKFIKDCYRKSLTDPRIRRRAEEWAGRGSRLAQTRNLFEAMKAGTVYMSDPVGVEMTKSPSVMMDQMEQNYSHTVKGDCDDLSCFAYAMLNSIGIPAKLRVVWFSGNALPSHIYVVAFPPGGPASGVPFDLASKRGFGYEHAYTRKMDF